MHKHMIVLKHIHTHIYPHTCTYIMYMPNDLHPTTVACRYVLLLKAMLDFTSPERSDYVVVQAAITKVKGYSLK